MDRVLANDLCGLWRLVKGCEVVSINGYISGYGTDYVKGYVKGYSDYSGYDRL